MIPVYRDSYPHQRNQVPFAQYYCPSYDGVTTQMMVDQSRPPIMCEYWPHGYNYGYSIPCHGCCNHGNFPGFYGFQPNFSHFSPPATYCCGYHPPLPEAYPLHHTLLPHQAMEQRRYEYDKDARRDYHCCGCPNHISDQKNDKDVIIEEQEPDAVKKSDSLVPIQSKNIPNPTVWIPPEYIIKSDKHRRPFVSEVANQEKVPGNKKSHENMKYSEGEPRVQNAWFPLDMNSLKSLMQGEDEKGKQNIQNEDGMRQLLYPIIWKPFNNEQREPEKDDHRNMNGWFPFDMNSLKSLMQGEDEKRKQNQQNNEDGMRQLSHPIMWMPSNNEQGVPEKDQSNMNSWFPIDMKRKSLMQSEDEKRMENQQNEDKMRQYPYPITWMPLKSEQGEVEKKDRRNMNAAPTSAEEPPSGLKLERVKPAESDGSMKKSETNKEKPQDQAKSSQMMESTGNQKIIPVKQMEVHREEDHLEGAKQKVTADKSSGTNKKRQSSSPSKASKLPPVCLRLEPLPGKKKGNGNSRSPSPPGLNRLFQGDTTKPSASSNSIEKTPEGTQSPGVSLKTNEEVEPKKSEQKGIDMVDSKTCENKNEHLRSGAEMENFVNVSIGPQEVVTGKSSPERSGKDGDGCGLKEDKGVRCERDMTVKGATEESKINNSAELVGGECEVKKKNLSDIQAAVLIQSAYRGFEVRELEPIKKLKQMAEVCQQVAEVRNRIQTLESSTDLQKYDKERVVIGEMIMRLLLKLDTIQGLHPSLRDIRKALAKDLVTLQEELDSLTMKSKGLSEEVTAAKVANDPSIGIRDDEILECSSNPGHDDGVNKKEQDQDELFNMVDLASNSWGQQSSELALGDKEVNGRCEHEMKEELSEGNYVESQVGESSADMVRDESANRLVDFSQAVLTEIQEGDDMHPQPQQCAGLPLISEEKTSSQELTGAQIVDSCFDPNGENEAAVGGVNSPINFEDNPEAESTELPLKMIDEESSRCEMKNDEPADKGKGEIVDAEIKSSGLAGPPLPIEVDNIDEVGKAIATNVDSETNLVVELPIGVLEGDLDIDNKQNETGKAGPTLPTEVDNINNVGKAMVTNVDPETNLVAELPIGVLEENLTVYDKQIETGKDEGLSSGETSYNLMTNTTSPTESENVEKVMGEELPGNAGLYMVENPPSSAKKGGEGSTDEVHVDEDEDRGMIDVDQMSSLESDVTSVATGESEGTKEDQQQKVVDGLKEEDVLDKKSQFLEPESVIETDKVDEPNGSEITSDSQMSVDRNDILMEGDMKLIEENAKLREMMEKLMEAGKEQLTVISQLTGRVKDLERKLSRKKKLRTRRCKRATTAPSCK